MKNALLVVLSIIFALVVLEVGLRLYEPDSHGRILTITESKRGNYYDVIPGAHGVILGREVNINKFGYRGTAYPIAKPPSTRRLLFFGDSHTFSYGADDDSTYPAVVGRRLNGRQTTYQTINFGVPGQDLNQILAMAYDKIPAFDPDIVVLTIHEGDLLEGGGTVVIGGEEEDIGTLYRVKKFLLKNCYVARLLIPYGAGMLRQFFGWSPGVTTAEGDEISRDGPVWRRAKRELVDLDQYLHARGTSLVVVLFPNMVDFNEKTAHASLPLISDWLAKEGIPELNLLNAFEPYDARTLTASLLDKHPDEKGYEIAGDAVGRYLIDKLALN